MPSTLCRSYLSQEEVNQFANEQDNAREVDIEKEADDAVAREQVRPSARPSLRVLILMASMVARIGRLAALMVPSNINIKRRA
jgi:predicted protein tyrosine phosphatase